MALPGCCNAAAPGLMHVGCAPCREALFALLRSLITLLTDRETVSAPLLQTILQCFSLTLTRSDYEELVSLGIYPALFSLLVRSPLCLCCCLCAVPKHLRRLHWQEKIESLKAMAEEEQKEGEGTGAGAGAGAGAAMSTMNIRMSPGPVTKASVQTSAWALLDLLATTWLSLTKGTAGDAMDTDSALSPVFRILFSQLNSLASQVVKDSFAASVDDRGAKAAAFNPLLGAIGGATKANEAKASDSSNWRAMVAQKVGATASFGIVAAENKSAASDTADKYEDSFTIKLLNMLHKVVHLSEGRVALWTSVESAARDFESQAEAGNAATTAAAGGPPPSRRPALRRTPSTASRPDPLSSLLSLIRHGSARARLVASRILERVLLEQTTAATTEVHVLVDLCVRKSIKIWTSKTHTEMTPLQRIMEVSPSTRFCCVDPPPVIQ